MFRKLAATVVVLSLCLTGCSVSVTKDNGSSLRAEETFSVYYAGGDTCKDVTEDMLDYLQGVWEQSYNAEGYTTMILGDTMSTGQGSFRVDTSRIVKVYDVDESWTINGETEFFEYYKAFMVDYSSGASYAMSIETGKKGRVRIDGIIYERCDD